MKFTIPLSFICIFFSITCGQLDYIPLADSNNSLSSSAADSQHSARQSNPPADAPSELELAEIDLSSHFTVENPRVGDTLSYVIKAEWVNPKIPVSVMAPESLSFEGLTKLSVSTSSKKLAQNSPDGPKIKNQNFFVFHLKANLPGSGKALSARMPYYNALSKEKEYLTLAPQLINILPARASLWSFIWVKILLGLLALAAIGYTLFTLIKSEKSKGKPSTVPRENKKGKLKELKARLGAGDSKSLLLQMEEIAIDYFRDEKKISGQRFEDLLRTYLKSQGNENAAHWNKLKSQFELARFGGGQLASHEISDSYKTLCLCIHYQEDEHD